MRLNDDLKMGLMAIGMVLFALVACTKKIDPDKLDKLITGMFEEQLDLEVTEIDCPKDIKVEEGETFECVVEVDPKGKVPVIVKMTDSTGSIEAKTKYDVLNPKKLAKEIRGKLRNRGISGKVDCGDKVRTVKPDTDFKCKLKDGSSKKTIKVEINEDGDVNWRLK
jgi:hypothetical protein